MKLSLDRKRKTRRRCYLALIQVGKMDIALMVPMLLFSLPISTEDLIDCDHETWTFSNGMQVYLISMISPQKYNESIAICEQVGGDLLYFRDDNDYESFLDWYENDQQYCDNVGKTTRLGLYQDIWGHFRWTDGQLINDADHVHWGSGFPVRSLPCVAIQRCESWISDSCDNTRVFVCQAAKPCSSRPALIFGDGKRLENTDVTMVYEQDVSVTCLMRGSPNRVIKTELKCGDDQAVEPAHGDKSVTKSYHIDNTMDQKTCSCKSTLSSRSVESSTTVITFHTNPYLADASINGTSLSLEDGDVFVHKFYIITNPTPSTFTLVSSARNLTAKEYSIHLTQRADLKTQVKIKINSVTHTDYYVMTIHNGIPEELIYSFKVTVTRKRISSLFMIGIILGVLFSLIVSLFLNRQMSHETAKAAQDNDHSLHKSKMGTPPVNKTSQEDEMDKEEEEEEGNVRKSVTDSEEDGNAEIKDNADVRISSVDKEEGNEGNRPSVRRSVRASGESQLGVDLFKDDISV